MRIKFSRKSLFSPKHSGRGSTVTYSKDVKHSFTAKLGDINDGGVGRIGSTVVLFSGYDPLVKANFWKYDPVEKQAYIEGAYNPALPDITMPSHELMARPLETKHRHTIFETIKKWPHNRQFSGQSANARNYLNVYTMTQFLAEFLDWTIKTGTVRQFELTHPVLGTTFNVIINPYLLKPETIKSLYEDKYVSPDQNDSDNAHFTTAFTSESFKGTIITQLRLKLPFGTPGCVLFSYAMWHLQHVSFSMISNKKEALKALKLTDYAEENVGMFARDVLEHYAAIDMFDKIDSELLTAIARSFETGRDDRFRHFAYGKTTQWKQIAEALRYRDFQVITTYESFKSGSKSSFNIREKVNEYVEEYSSLVHSGHYGPAKKPARLPKAHLAEHEANALKQANLLGAQKALKAGKQKGGGGGGGGAHDQSLFKTHCTSCGKKKEECKKKHKEGRCSFEQTWRFSKKGDTYKLSVFTLHWCPQCGDNGSYRMHLPKNHDKHVANKARWAKTRNKKKEDGPIANLAAQESEDEAPLHGDFISSGSGPFS